MMLGTQLVARAQARGGVERGERLVKQQQRRLGGERARQRHPLLLAAGDGAWETCGKIGESECFQELSALSRRRSEGDVAGYGEMRE